MLVSIFSQFLFFHPLHGWLANQIHKDDEKKVLIISKNSGKKIRLPIKGEILKVGVNEIVMESGKGAFIVSMGF